MTKMYIASYVKYVLFLLELNEMCSNTNRFSKNTPIPNLMKILPVELSCSMRKEGQIDTQTDRQRAGRKDSYHEANSHLSSQFCESA